MNEYADWVNAVVITKNKEIVLVEQYRHPGQDFYLKIPAGRVEKHESYIEAIIRELKEETGFVSDTPPILLGEYMVKSRYQDQQGDKAILICDAWQAF